MYLVEFPVFSFGILQLSLSNGYGLIVTCFPCGRALFFYILKTFRVRVTSCMMRMCDYLVSCGSIGFVNVYYNVLERHQFGPSSVSALGQCKYPDTTYWQNIL